MKLKMSKKLKKAERGKKGATELQKQGTTLEGEQEAPDFLVTHSKNFLHSLFSNVEVSINFNQNYNSNGLFAHKAYISNNFYL